MSEFHYTNYAQQVIFGPGSLARLSKEVTGFGWQRLMLCATGSLRRDGTITAIETALGERLVAVYEGVQPHVPDFQVAEALALAEACQADALIGLGGGSPVGMAKAVSMALQEKRSGKAARVSLPIEQPLVPVVAIPTTYAGSEMTPVYGVTHHADGMTRKITVSDARIVPKLVIYDPLLTLHLPRELTASTGINALAHCIEALYSITRNPLATAVALRGVRAITSALPRCYARGDDVEARDEMLLGAFMAGTALAHVTMALHHGLCHVLGGTAGVPHGIANSIILPHALRFNLDAVAPELAEAAGAMGISLEGRDAEAAAEQGITRVSELIGSIGLPQRLRDAGVKEAELPHLARLAFVSRTVQSNPRPIRDEAEIEALLRAAW